MKVYSEKSLYNFTRWSGAVYNYNRIIEAGKAEEFEYMIEDLYPDGIDETTLNDILWFEDELINEFLGEEEE